MSSAAMLGALLRIGPYRRFLVASTLVSVSLWTLQVGLIWTVLEETGSALVVGLLQAAMSIAIPVVTIPAGILADRLGPRDLMAACYLAMMACVAAMAALSATGALSVPLALALAISFGLFDGLSLTPTHVMVGRIVPRERMSAAISFSTIAYGIGRIVGGPLGGILLVSGGPATSLGAAALGFLGASLLLLTVPRPAALAGGVPPRLRDISEAWRWVRSSRPALSVVVLGAVSALCLWPYVALLPVVVRDLVAGEATDLGWLVAAAGLGAIVAAFVTEPLGRALGRGRALVGSIIAGGTLLLALASARDAVTAIVVAVLVSVAVVVWTATTNVLLQSLAPPSIRGRVLALHGVLYFSCIPLGTLAAGFVADLIGVTATLVLLGLLSCGGALVTVAVDRSLLDRGLLDVGVVRADRQEGSPSAAGAMERPAGAPIRLATGEQDVTRPPGAGDGGALKPHDGAT